MNIKDLEVLVVEQGLTIEGLQKQVEELSKKVEGFKVRDRGPKSSRTMTDLDAWRVMHGDLKGTSHREAAKALGLSYGQVYSARGDYTFKHVKPDSFTLEQIPKDEPVEEVKDETEVA